MHHSQMKCYSLFRQVHKCSALVISSKFDMLTDTCYTNYKLNMKNLLFKKLTNTYPWSLSKW